MSRRGKEWFVWLIVSKPQSETRLEHVVASFCGEKSFHCRAIAWIFSIQYVIEFRLQCIHILQCESAELQLTVRKMIKKRKLRNNQTQFIYFEPIILPKCM